MDFLDANRPFQYKKYKITPIIYVDEDFEISTGLILDGANDSKYYLVEPIKLVTNILPNRRMRPYAFLKTMIRTILNFTKEFHFNWTKKILSDQCRFMKMVFSVDFKEMQDPTHNFEDHNALQSLDFCFELHQKYGR